MNRLWVPGTAKSERKRQRVVTDKSGRAFMGHRTDEPDRADWKSWVGTLWRASFSEPMHGPLCVALTFVRNSPSGTPKHSTPKHPWPWAWMTKPDLDNLAKPVLDALTRAEAWVDDAQIIRVEVHKVQSWSVLPGVLIEVREGWPADIPSEACIAAL